MDSDLLGLAFGAGLVAALNPCGFAMLPAYLTLVVQGEGAGRLTALGRSLAATAAMTLGFLAVFAVFGTLTVSAAATVQRFLPYITVVIGIGLVALGIWLLLGRHLGLLMPHRASGRWAPSGRLGSMFGYGVGYATASLSCTVGPFLAVTGASLRSGSPATAVITYLAYAGGFALVVGVLAVAAAVAGTAVIDRMRRIVPYANRIGGALVVVVGLYVAYYGLYEVRLLSGTGNPADPVIGAAGRLQATIAGWVHAHGGWPWLAALAALIVLGLGATLWARHASVSRGDRGSRSPSGRPATADGEPS